MKKTTKGAIAAGSAAVLLLGGAGTLAFWTSTQDVPGGTITSGQLALGAPSCSGWTLDSGEATTGAPFVPGTSLLVPGDVISQECTVALTAVGDHLRATITAEDTSMTGDLAPFLTAEVSQVSINGAPVTEFTEADNGETASVTVSVTFDPAAGEPSKDVAATLDAITISATQIHS